MAAIPSASRHSLPPAVFLMGPTASGKTAVAVELAGRLPCEIISVDSALVYRHMNIGTAKPDAVTLAAAPHHLIDIIEPDQSYSAAQFREDALRLMQEITMRGRIPLLAGGTMLYFRALQHGLSDLPRADAKLRAELDARARESGWPALHAELKRLDPATAERLKPNDAQRIQRALEVCYLSGRPMSEALRRGKAMLPPFNVIPVALAPSDRYMLHQRIEQRFDAMLRQGLVAELEWLRSRYALEPSMPSMRCVGYRQAWKFLEGEYGLPELREKGIAATRQLAKRQLTWLRAMPEAKVVDCLMDNAVEKVLRYLEGVL